MTVSTSTSQLEPSPALRDKLAIEWQRFARPGTWWSSEQRLALAHSARAAREGNDDTSQPPVSCLPPLAAAAATRIASAPGTLDGDWYEELLSAGLLPEQVVEMAGLVSILSIGDSLAYALERPLAELPPAQAGEPSRQRQPGTDTDASWAPTVRPDLATGSVRDMYRRSSQRSGGVPNVVRALTAVPDELRGFFAVFRCSYDTVRVPEDGALSRPQMELVAASVSAVNDCFY